MSWGVTISCRALVVAILVAASPGRALFQCGYTVNMKSATIGIRELRDGLSRHLADVRAGSELTVTDHGRPIARIVPIGAESGLESLVRAGLATLPLTPRAELPEPVEASGTVSDLVADQRR